MRSHLAGRFGSALNRPLHRFGNERSETGQRKERKIKFVIPVPADFGDRF
jgi:hypothetical protein